MADADILSRSGGRAFAGLGGYRLFWMMRLKMAWVERGSDRELRYSQGCVIGGLLCPGPLTSGRIRVNREL